MDFAGHPIFEKFTPFSGVVPADCEVDFIGTLGHRDYVSSDPPGTERMIALETQAFDNEYFEWIDVLESVDQCGATYTMLEIGAGYGRWACRAALAARQRGVAKIRIGAVEGEPAHARWLENHLKLNGLSDDEMKVYACAVGAESGSAMFTIGTATTEPEADPRTWYGQRLVQVPLARITPDGGDRYFGHEVFVRRNGSRLIEVSVKPLAEVLADFGRVDLIDFDIQGEELAAISSAIDLMDGQVARIHIGTHTLEIEAGLRELLSAHGWHCRYDFSLNAEHATPYGNMLFEDGVQSWVNPRLG